LGPTREKERGEGIQRRKGKKKENVVQLGEGSTNELSKSGRAEGLLAEQAKELLKLSADRGENGEDYYGSIVENRRKRGKSKEK